MKAKKFVILILAIISAIALSASLSACSFIDEIFGKEPVCVHEYGAWEDETNTCTQHIQKRVCALCGEEETQTLTPVGHSYGAWEDVVNTCTEHTQKRVCGRCRAEETQNLAPAGHKYGEKEVVVNTCTEHIEKQVCVVCKEATITYIYDAFHDYGAWQDVVNTCTEHTQKRICAKCGDTDTRNLTPAGHSFGAWEDETNTCTQHMQVRTCGKCSEKETKTLTATGHSFGEWQDETNTCTQHTQVRTCGKCSEKETKTLPANGHVYGGWTDETVTCAKHTQSKICEVCGDTLTREIDGEHKYTDGRCVYCNGLFYDGDTSVLDKYNGTYGYEYFKSQNLTAQYTLYERIDAAARAYHLGKDINAQEYSYQGDNYYLVSAVNYSDLGLTFEAATSVWKTFKDDNPLYYWLSGALHATDTQLKILSAEAYAQGEVRSQTNDLVYNKVAEYSLVTDVSDNAYRKALAFHDGIISAIDYAYESSGVPQTADWAHSVIGVFEERGAVCEGYARTFQLLLNYSGIENIFVSGRGNSEEHAWNLVKLDDGNWYWCDLTWDDTPNWEWGISYNYFLVNDTQQTNLKDGGWSAATKLNFLDAHTPHTPDGESVQFLYELPARASKVFSDETFPILRQTITAGSFTYAVTGYNTVQVVKSTATGAVAVPQTVTYKGITYTVISIGRMDERGLFNTGGESVFSLFTTSVSVPQTVKFIWEHAFNFGQCESITVDGQNDYFCSVDGVLFTKSMKTLLFYPSYRAEAEYRIPEQVTQVTYEAFTTNRY